VASTHWPKLAFAQRSDPGRDPGKQVNEDAAHYQETPLGHLLVVCDGMGGHASGREASNLAIAVIAREVSAAPATANAGEVLRNAVVNAGRQVFSLGGIDNNPSRPGSTCVALLMHPGGTEVAHIGDSRAYLLRKGHLWALTRDHSMVQQMVDNGLLRPEEAATHPDSNKITRALGMRPDSDVELRLEPMLQEPRDLFLLITDGVSDVVPDPDLQSMAAAAVESGNVESFCEQVIALANARGGPDNCTIQAALVLDPGLDQELVRRRAPVPTQVDLDGPPGLALDPLATPATVPPPGAPALEQRNQRTLPLTPAPATFGAVLPPGPPSPAAPPGAPALGGQPSGPQPTVGQPPAGHPAAAFGAPPAQPQPPQNASRRPGPTIPFALTPDNGMPAAPLAMTGAAAQDPAPAHAAAAPLPPPPQPGVTPAAPRRRKGLIIVGVVLFVIGAAIVGVVAWFLLNGDEPPSDVPEAPAPTAESTSAPVIAAPPPPPSAHPPQLRVGAPPGGPPSIHVPPPPPRPTAPASLVPNPLPPKAPSTR
jgi:PPM family protein phosphatase